MEINEDMRLKCLLFKIQPCENCMQKNSNSSGPCIIIWIFCEKVEPGISVKIFA